MTRTQLLSTAAALLLLGAGVASAQGQPNPEPAPAAQQNAPPEKIAPAGEHKAPGKPETTGQPAKEPVPGHVQGGAKSDANVKGSADSKMAPAKPETSGAAANDKSSADVKAKPDSKAATETHKDMSKDSTVTKSGESSKSSTTGQGAAAGSAKLSTEQRTKITTVIKKQNVKPVHVNFSISVGTRVPRTVHYYPLPTEVVTIYPEWRGYDYILVGDQILVIDPDRHEIVAILEA
jgi:hypothetical protein